jgi:membrane-bound ClpP family serine protease
MMPAGRVEMNGRIIDAVAEGSLIDAQKQVHVVSIDGIRVGVAPGARPDVSHANDLQDDKNQPAS